MTVYREAFALSWTIFGTNDTSNVEQKNENMFRVLNAHRISKLSRVERFGANLQ